MIELDIETFIPATELSKNAEKYGWHEGSVDVTFQGKTQRVQCIAPSGQKEDWTIYGLCARYATGSKVWRATIVYKNGRVTHISTGFDNRSGRFSQPRLVGFIEGVSDQNVSKR